MACVDVQSRIGAMEMLIRGGKPPVAAVFHRPVQIGKRGLLRRLDNQSGFSAFLFGSSDVSAARPSLGPRTDRRSAVARHSRPAERLPPRI